MRALIAWRPDWKTRAIAAILKHRRGAFIDVGANVGQTLLDFLSAPARSSYLGFEPNLTCSQHLAELLAINCLNESRVIPAALGERNGVDTLYRFGGDADPGASTRRELRPDLEVRTTTIATFRLDDLSEIFPEAEMALMKIDVEGSELEVLRGMETTLRKFSPWILCEVLHRDSAAEPVSYRRRCAALMELLVAHGYTVWQIVQDYDGQHIRALLPVSAFPDVVWSEGSVRACDYLFVPGADVEAAEEWLVQ